MLDFFDQNLDMPSAYQPEPTLKVSQAIDLCNQALGVLEVAVIGEVANFSIYKNNLVFFDLKDEEAEARLSCFMWRSQLSVPIEDGMRVVARGSFGIYAKTGSFRLTVNHLAPEGEGSLKRAFELLKKKLASEGLFESDRKRKIPYFPSVVGIVSSSDAAGFGDFMKIAKQRAGGIRFVLANCAVQGVKAEKELVAGIDYLNSQFELDVLVVIRGGGSTEDLHAFNSEPVARAIARSKAPVVVGVGHERDETIADYVADLRASTPSNAAQLVVPDQIELLARLGSDRAAESKQIWHQLEQLQRQVDKIIAFTRERTRGVVSGGLERAFRIVQTSRWQLEQALKSIASQAQSLIDQIEVLAPHKVLERGYTITTNNQGDWITSIQQIKDQQSIQTNFTDGSITSVTQLK